MCVRTKLNVGLELKGHSLVYSLNHSGAGSLQADSAPHPPTASFLTLFLYLLQLINPQVFPSTESFLLHKWVSASISHLSSIILLPFPLLWIGMVQSAATSAGVWLPTNKASHFDMKGYSFGRTKICVPECAYMHVCVYIHVYMWFIHLCTFVFLLACFSQVLWIVCI